MSLPASQRRALNRIEKALVRDHSGLGPLFAIFTRLTGHEAMPVLEQVTARPWHWRLPPGVMTIAGLAMATGALLALSLTLSSPQVCVPRTAIAAAHVRSVPGGRQLAACPTQPSTPSKTSQNGLQAH
jgi:hypothetical protein